MHAQNPPAGPPPPVFRLPRFLLPLPNDAARYAVHRAPRAKTDGFVYKKVTWGGLAYESQPFAKKVASALALFAPLGTKLAHSARVRTIKHRLERWKPLECPRRAVPMAAKECFGERTTSRDPQKNALRGLRALCTLLRAATVHAALIQSVLETLKAAACESLDG